MTEFKSLAEMEREHIIHALEVYDGNKPKAAKALGITTKTLYNKLHEYGWQPSHVIIKLEQLKDSQTKETPSVVEVLPQLVYGSQNLRRGSW